MPYRTLEKILHADSSSDRFSHAESVYRERLNAESTFRTGIELKTGELFLAMPRELSLAHEQLLRRERRVSALWKSLPTVALHAYIKSLILDEVISSNGIEGVHSARKEVELALEVAERDTAGLTGAAGKEHAPFAEFAKLYLGLTDNPKMPATLQEIRGIFDSVVKDAIDKKDVPASTLFRTGPVAIQDGRGRTHHEGVDPQRIEGILGQWLTLSQSEQIPETLSAILCHFLFGYIHPFYDGNGRTGRYLLALQLSAPLSEPTVLSLSRTIADNKNAYYKAFDAVENPLNHAEATPFVLTMLELIGEAQETLIADLERKRATLDRLAERIDGIEADLSERERDALFIMGQMDLIGGFEDIRRDDLRAALKVSDPTVRNALRELGGHRLVTQTSKRPPVYRLTPQARSFLIEP